MPEERNAASRQQLPTQQSIQPPLYTPAGFYMLRAPVLSTNIFKQIAATDIQTLLDSGEELEVALTKVQQQSYDILKELIARPEIEQALLAASTSLFEGIRLIQNGEASHRAKRAYASVLRYLVRMSTRSTPFGLFSGVASGILSEHTTARLATPPVQRIRTRPGMNWLFSIIQLIEQDEKLIPQLHVAVNHTVYRAGARVIIPLADVYGQIDQRLITLRAVPALQYVLDHARQPIAYRDLRDGLLATFANATEQQMDSFLHQLWEHHILISNLRPPLTSIDPAKYMLEQLSALPGAASVTATLREVLTTSSEIDRAGIGGPPKLIHTLLEQQEQLIPRNDQQKGDRPPFQIDTALHLENPCLNAAIGEAAARAAEALLRLGPAPLGFPHLREYHAAFLERYGAGAEVPLLDLLSPETGLDAPSGYTEPPREYPLRTHLPPSNTTAYDSALCSLLAEAVNKRAVEIELTDQLLAQLAQWNPQTGNPPAPLLEIYLQLHASSREALDRGEWRAVVNPGALAIDGRTFCRFFDIMGDEALEQLRAYIEREESLFPDVIFAELSYLPISGRGANVAVRPALRSYEIVVNTTPSVPPDRVIPLHDLVVGASLDGFYIRSQRLRKKVIVCQGSMLNIQAGPNVCRFLLEVSMNTHLLPAAFHWGIARNAPFLPRIVRGKVVLSAAQWTVQASTIIPAGEGSDEVRWFTGVQQWRTQWRVPRYVYLVESDNLLLLDLEHPLMVAELRTAIKKSGSQPIRLREMLPDFEHLWLHDGNDAPYMAELVVPLIVRKQADMPESTTPAIGATTPRAAQRGYAPRVIAHTERRKFPGDEWTFLKLYAAIRQYDEIISAPLRNVVQQMYEQGLIDRWFYIRYTDPETHLRVRFHAVSPQTQEKVLTSALAWSRTLVEHELVSRICVDSYDREIERYGGPAAIDAMETVFTADSTVTSELVAALYKRDITLDPLAVAVFSLDQFFAAWGLDFAARLQYIQSRTRKYEANDAFRSRRKLLCELLAPWDTNYDENAQAQREQLRALWAPQTSSIEAVARQIRALAANGELWQSEEHILGSLAHMHINRLLGFGRERERQIYQFWRHTLESVQRRPARKPTPTRVRTTEEG
jgi:lantibiotic biosynthesis protein